MEHKCIASNDRGIEWECHSELGKLYLSSEGVADKISVKFCPFCGITEIDNESIDEIVLELQQYSLPY